MNTKKINIAIDGPSGAGKSTIAKILARELGFIYVDTGAMYRSIGLYMLRNGVDSTDLPAVQAALQGIEINIAYVDGAQHIYLNGEDVSELIRTEAVSKAASAFSAIPEVRAFLLELQRGLAAKNSVIMDGRDIGTVILPNAEVKIFLTADDTARAERRYKELIEKGQEVTFESVLENIRQRDKNDSERALAPLKPAEDAILVDTTKLDLMQSVEAMKSVILEKMK
ncbi:MAG: (d)CMP kinase [Clostridia bacterium]|nr:(d)CMP kinase [Clostridia bacterium]MBQ3092219.1 (d)CMP kinase [Clostridia bacterium]